MVISMVGAGDSAAADELSWMWDVWYGRWEVRGGERRVSERGGRYRGAREVIENWRHEAKRQENYCKKEYVIEKSQA
eukprot:scaffold495_cov152-Skeletonema_menzelii.AAC.3